MNRATATTTAKAVRQHGGGLVHATQPRAALRGRHQCPRGGVKKSLCCAAAGINALDLQATTALGYPMTGVRQAQKLSTPLRSPIRLSAQLVVGYEHPHSALIRLYQQHRRSDMRVQQAQLQYVPIVKNGDLMKHHTQCSSAGCGTLEMPHIDHLTGHQANQRYCLNRFNMSFPAKVVPLFEVRIQGVLPKIVQRLRHGPTQMPELRQLILSQLEYQLSKPPSLPPRLVVLMPNGERASTHNSQNGSKRLHPISSITSNPKVLQHYKESPAYRADGETQPHDPHAGHRHPLWQLELAQLPPLLITCFARRVPATTPDVHGGAA